MNMHLNSNIITDINGHDIFIENGYNSKVIMQPQNLHCTTFAQFRSV